MNSRSRLDSTLAIWFSVTSQESSELGTSSNVHEVKRALTSSDERYSDSLCKATFVRVFRY